MSRRFEANTEATYQERRDGIVSFIADNGGNASIRSICEWLGYSWPAELESVRGILNKMVGKGILTKSIRPNHETRVAYYCLPAVSANGLLGLTAQQLRDIANMDPGPTVEVGIMPHKQS